MPLSPSPRAGRCTMETMNVIVLAGSTKKITEAQNASYSAGRQGFASQFQNTASVLDARKTNRNTSRPCRLRTPDISPAKP